MARRIITDETKKRRILELYPSMGLKEVARQVGEPMLAVREYLVSANVALRSRGRPRRTLPLNGEIRLTEETSNPSQTVFDWD